ncbi:hypothetical protein ACFLV0_02760 [Chloroflexota bacterium]
MANILMVIAPYWYQGTWAFDDESVVLIKEPFVAGVPEIIDDLVTELSQKGSMPTLLDFERTCRLPITDAFLKEKGISNEKRVWFCNQLPKSLYHLRRARNRAEHESADQWTRQDLNKFYDEFIGIGQSGILPELCRILLF